MTDSFPGPSSPIRVFLVDDSRLVRRALRRALEATAEVVVVGEAASGEEALARIPRAGADVVLMDIMMRGMDGLAATEALMARAPHPILIVSEIVGRDASLGFRALASGALNLIRKPTAEELAEREGARLLVRRIRVLAGVPVLTRRRREAAVVAPRDAARWAGSAAVQGGAPTQIAPKLVCIGASTGGPPALLSLLQALRGPLRCPIVIVQHMAPGFLEPMTRWLSDASKLGVVLAGHGAALTPGAVVVAPDHAQLLVRDGRLALDAGAPARDGHRPSIDVLFESVAESAIAGDVLAVLLTGMGSDGARGLLRLAGRGAWTIAQDEATSIIYGMPRVASELGAAREVLPLDMIGRRLASACAPHQPAGGAT